MKIFHTHENALGACDLFKRTFNSPAMKRKKNNFYNYIIVVKCKNKIFNNKHKRMFIITYKHEEEFTSISRRFNTLMEQMFPFY